jgi:hypothetical protein
MPCKGLGKYNGWGEFSRGEPAASIFDFAVRVFLKRMLAEDFERLVEQHGGLEWRLFMRVRVGAGSSFLLFSSLALPPAQRDAKGRPV